MSGPDGNRPRLRRWDSALTVLVSALVSFVVILGVLELADRAPITDAPEAREPQPERTAADEIARPTPVPPLELHPAGAPIAITVRDAAARTTAGQTVRIPEARLLVELGDEPGEPLLRVRRAVVERPVITMPPGDGEDAPGTTATGGGVAGLAGLDLPYIVVESLVIRGGSLGELARADGGTGWTFLWEDVNLAIRDVVLGGEGARRLAFDLSLDGRVGGQTVRLESVTGAARQGVIPGDTSAVEFDAQVRIGASLVAARGIARPDGTVELEVRADTLDFPGLSGIMAVIPEEGGGAGTIRVVRTPERTVVELMDAAATVAGYRLQARGRAVATEEVIQVDAELTRPAQAGLSRLRVRGTVEPDEIPRLALTVDAVPVILGDSLFTGRLLVTGPTDSITVRGALALNRTGALAVLADTTPPPAVPDSMPSDRQPVIALVDATITGIEDDAPRAEGTIDFIASPGAIGLAAGDPIRAQVEGGAALGPGGELAATVRLDTLPLALIPFPSGIAEVRGHATGGLTVSGTTETPILEGELRVADGEALIVDPGLRITDLQGDLRLADDLVTLGGVTARAGGGDVALEGTVSLDGPLDVRARVDSVQVLDEEDAQLELDAVLALSGTRDAPVVRGRARPSGWIHEAFAESEPGLDLEDPPYAELAARVPWLQRSRLRQDPPPAPSDTATSPVAGDSALGVIAGAAA
ncbi:MAG TPA: hypothetical protein VK966_09010, partial [Longimicrobiales bacterium]|nr:hypothetical protein [Longimicrobiales bacterium]